jgi:hypothetical protein
MPGRALRSTVVAVVFGLSLASVGAGRALAQTPGSGPPMPMSVDLAKVAVGSYGDYAMTFGQMPPMSMRIALVGKSGEGNVLESSVEGGMMAQAGGKVVVQMTLPSGKDAHPTKMVMQMGNNDPMEMPSTMASQGRFTKPDPKKLVKSESVTVKAGTFKTKHYRDKTPQGDTFDFWVADKVPPLGLVKMTGEQNSNPMMKGPFSFELTSTGKDAKSAITKPAKPYDQQALLKQMMAGHGGAGAAGGPPAGGGAPSGATPAPAAPPKP